MEKQILRIIKENCDKWLSRKMTKETRNEVIDLVKLGMGNASASAMQGNFWNILFFDQKFDQDKQVLLISYEELVNQPEIQVKKICRFCFVEIEYTSRMNKGIVRSFINRRKQPDIDSKIRMLCNTLMSKLKTQLEA